MLGKTEQENQSLSTSNEAMATVLCRLCENAESGSAFTYRGQLTSCYVTTEILCRGHTHQVAVCACCSGESGEMSQRQSAV